MKPSDQGVEAEGPGAHRVADRGAHRVADRGAHRVADRGAHRFIAEFAIVAFVVIQLLLPIAGLAWRGPSLLAGRDLDGRAASRFSWHMFSVAPPTPNSWVLALDDGTLISVDSVDEFGLVRGRMHYSAGLAEAVCGLHPGAQSATHAFGSYPC